MQIRIDLQLLDGVAALAMTACREGVMNSCRWNASAAGPIIAVKAKASVRMFILSYGGVPKDGEAPGVRAGAFSY